MNCPPFSLMLVLTTVLAACGDKNEQDETPHVFTAMEGALADCEFDLLTFKNADGSLAQVSVNGLAVEALNGAVKVSPSEWEVVARRGVRLSTIFSAGGLTTDETTPVNCIARDGWDPLRTQLGSDTALLPRFDFMRDHGYVYVGNPGDKDPLYPEMEGRSLMVDYDVNADTDVPSYLGGSISGLSKFRYKMVEEVDAERRGVFEIDPVVP